MRNEIFRFAEYTYFFEIIALNFVVHSNESASRKSRHVDLEKVIEEIENSEVLEGWKINLDTSAYEKNVILKIKFHQIQKKKVVTTAKNFVLKVLLKTCNGLLFMVLCCMSSIILLVKKICCCDDLFLLYLMEFYL